MFTKAFLPVKPEFVCRVLPIHTGLQCVAEAAGAQFLHRRVDQCGRVGLCQRRVTPHVGGELQGARVVARRQLGKHAQLRRHLQRPVAEVGVTGGLVTHQLTDGAVGEPLQVGGHTHAPTGQVGCLLGRVHGQHPGVLVGLHGDFVADAGAADHQVGRRLHTLHAVWRGREGAPFAAVKTAQHRPAEVQLPRGWSPPARQVKAHPQRNAVVQCQLGDVADLHGGRQATAPGAGVVWCAPQRAHTRKQHKQRRHDRGPQQHHLACHASGL